MLKCDICRRNYTLLFACQMDGIKFSTEGNADHIYLCKACVEVNS